MKAQTIAIALTVINIVIITILLTRLRPAYAQAQQQNPTAVLRGSGLEIVDKLGRLRATITLQPPVETGGKKYPETILFRLIDQRGKPMVKIGASDDGAGLTLINQSDEGVIIHGHNDSSFLKIYHKGRERMIKP